MPSKDFLVTEPGLTYVLYAQRLTPSDVAELQQFCGKDDSFTVKPYTQKLQRQLRANFNKFYNIT
jgi:hypothetical protein